MEAAECGAASLAMVLAHHGRWVPLEELRVACGVSRDGSRADYLLDAAQNFGLETRAFRKEPAQLRDLPLPSILHWKLNHFVVFEGFRGERASINDPAIGRCWVSPGELSDAFTGVVLTFEPSGSFRKAGARLRALPTLWRHLAASGSGLALVALSSLMLVVPGIVLPAWSKLFVDEVVMAGRHDWVRPLLLGLVVTGVLRTVILWFRQIHLLRLEAKLGVVMASNFLWHVLRLPPSYFTQRHAGDVASRVVANEGISNLLSGGLATTILNLVSAAFFAAAMLTYDPLLASIALLVAAVSFGTFYLVSSRREDATRRLAQDRGRLIGHTAGLVQSIETIKSMGSELDVFSRWAGLHAKTLAAAQESDRHTNILSIVPSVVAGLANAAILGVGSLRIIHGNISVGDLVAFQTLAASFSEPIRRLIAFGARLQQIKADLTRAADVLAHAVDPRAPTAQPRAATGPSFTRLSGAVELRGISFGYNPNAPPLIENFDLVVRPGQRIGLVGASGSGKSTVGRLICGLYAPWSGQILFDGRAIEDIPRSVLADAVAYVDQDAVLFAGTVRDNVTLWDDGIGNSRVADALREATIFEDIAKHPELYNYRLGEGGTGLSGGQRQRLEIARALIGEPTILVLDEATSALDPLTEQQIGDNLRRRGCSCVIIAHRYSTVRDCDKIVVLSEGCVVGRGTHDELIADCRHYAELLRVA